MPRTVVLIFISYKCGKCNDKRSGRTIPLVSDSLANGRRIKFLTVADDFSHECVDTRGGVRKESRW